MPEFRFSEPPQNANHGQKPPSWRGEGREAAGGVIQSFQLLPAAERVLREKAERERDFRTTENRRETAERERVERTGGGLLKMDLDGYRGGYGAERYRETGGGTGGETHVTVNVQYHIDSGADEGGGIRRELQAHNNDLRRLILDVLREDAENRRRRAFV